MCSFSSNILKNRNTNRNIHQHAYTLKAGVLPEIKTTAFLKPSLSFIADSLSLSVGRKQQPWSHSRDRQQEEKGFLRVTEGEERFQGITEEEQSVFKMLTQCLKGRGSKSRAERENAGKKVYSTFVIHQHKQVVFMQLSLFSHRPKHLTWQANVQYEALTLR